MNCKGKDSYKIEQLSFDFLNKLRKRNRFETFLKFYKFFHPFHPYLLTSYFKNLQQKRKSNFFLAFGKVISLTPISLKD